MRLGRVVERHARPATTAPPGVGQRRSRPASSVPGRARGRTSRARSRSSATPVAPAAGVGRVTRGRRRSRRPARPAAGVVGRAPMSASTFIVACWMRASGSPSPCMLRARPRHQLLVPVAKTERAAGGPVDRRVATARCRSRTCARCPGSALPATGEVASVCTPAGSSPLSNARSHSQPTSVGADRRGRAGGEVGHAGVAPDAVACPRAADTRSGKSSRVLVADVHLADAARSRAGSGRPGRGRSTSRCRSGPPGRSRSSCRRPSRGSAMPDTGLATKRTRQ